MTKLASVVLLQLSASLICLGCSPPRVYQQHPKAAQSGSKLININVATADQLKLLPGIGDGLAERIVEFRAANGPFRRPAHLMLVEGISERRFYEIAPYICVE